MKTATLRDLPAIQAAFSAYPQEILPVPKSILEHAVVNGQMIWDSGVALYFRRSTDRRYCGVDIGAGAYQVMDIANVSPGNGQAKRVLMEFIREVHSKVFLLVKTDNHRAQEFYERLGFTRQTTWVFKNFSSYLMVRPWQ